MIDSRSPFPLMAAPFSPMPSSAAQPRRQRRPSSTPSAAAPPSTCRRSPSAAAADGLVLVAVLLASGYLALPCFQLFHRGITAGVAAAGRDLGVAPVAVACAAGGLAVAGLALAAIARRAAEGRRCENPGCLGLRDAPEFDVKIETEEMCARGSPAAGGVDGTEGGFFELSGDHNRELEAKLKKVAPVNGRAVLVFRAKCGCSAGRMVVWGSKKGKKVRK